MLAKALDHQNACLEGTLATGWKPQFAVHRGPHRLTIVVGVGDRGLIEMKTGTPGDGGEEPAGNPEAVVEAYLEVRNLPVGFIDPEGALQFF